MNQPNDKCFSKEDIDQFIKDNSDALQITAGVYADILKTSLTQTQSDIDQIEQALKLNDFDQACKLAHRIKGAYQNLRIELLGDMCFQMEKNARERKQVEDILGLHADVKNVIESLKTYFKDHNPEN